MTCLHSVDSRRRVLEQSHASDRGRVPRGGASLSLLLGQGSPAVGACDSTGHHAMLPSSCTPMSRPSALTHSFPVCILEARTCDMLFMVVVKPYEIIKGIIGRVRERGRETKTGRERGRERGKITAQKPAAGRLRGDSFWVRPRVSRRRAMPASSGSGLKSLVASSSRQCRRFRPLAGQRFMFSCCQCQTVIHDHNSCADHTLQPHATAMSLSGSLLVMTRSLDPDFILRGMQEASACTGSPASKEAAVARQTDPAS